MKFRPKCNKGRTHEVLSRSARCPSPLPRLSFLLQCPMSSTNVSSQNKSPNAAYLNPTPLQLRSLVLDYLCHNCYTTTARAFARDSTPRHLDADGDEVIAPGGLEDPDSIMISEATLRQVEMREEIQEQILAGRVDDATELLQRYFPSVLAEQNHTYGNPEQVRGTSTDHLEYLSQTSIEPQHLNLNLRILAFSEACRTVPLVYPLKKGSSLATVVAQPVPLPHDEEDESMNLEQQTALLTRAQKLYALANALQHPVDRNTYMRELENVGGLLAYKVPETSSIAKYLTLERREAVADQINRAILKRTGQASTSSLELITRYTYALWSQAHQFAVKPKPGAVLPPWKSVDGPKATDTTPIIDIVPTFDLQQFLDSKS